MSIKTIVITYKPTLLFITKFSGIYLLLVWLYQIFLSGYRHQTDPITIQTGKWVSTLFKFTGMQAETIPLENEQGLKLLINGEYIARIIEGCTAIGIIILFTAFIIGFGNSFKKSILFALAGSLLIYIFNLFRIVFLGYLMYVFPQWQDPAHRVVFPGMIYGFVIFLWIFFIKKINNENP